MKKQMTREEQQSRIEYAQHDINRADKNLVEKTHAMADRLRRLANELDQEADRYEKDVQDEDRYAAFISVTPSEYVQRVQHNINWTTVNLDADSLLNHVSTYDKAQQMMIQALTAEITN